jgi:hypothetical protein
MLQKQNDTTRTRDVMLSPCPTTPEGQRKNTLVVCPKSLPKLKMNGGPRVKGGRASIENPTYLRETHKPKKRDNLKPLK